MKIYITRHGETEWNKEDRLQGFKNSRLTKEGIGGAIKLSQSLSHIDFDYIYTSPLARALETAKLIKKDKKTPIVELDGLKEINLGKWEGMKKTDIKALYPESYYNFWNNPKAYIPHGGESFKDLFLRIDSVLKIILQQKCENILIVSHGISLKVLFCIMKDTAIEDFWETSYLDNNSLTIVDLKDNEVSFIIENDTSHLL